MCRIFAFRSVLQSQVHRSLLDADNALLNKSQFHPNGWGVAHYLHGVPHIIKSTEAAFNDSLFKRISGIVSSQTVLAHIRNATQGDVSSTVNCHPFQYGHWSFIHNGNIENFDQHKPELLKLIPDHLKRFILGTTDSEIIFFILLSYIEQLGDLEKIHHYKKIETQIYEALKKISDIVGPIHNGEMFDNKHTFLTFSLTNGKQMFGFHGGQSLYFSTHKSSCPESDTCPHFLKNCVNKTEPGNFVNHFILSSEPLAGENIWHELKPGDLLGVDEHMFLQRNFLDLEVVNL